MSGYYRDSDRNYLYVYELLQAHYEKILTGGFKKITVNKGILYMDEVKIGKIVRKSLPKRNKYGSRKEEYNGRVYHSAKEAAYARELDLRMKAGEIADWLPQFKLSLDMNGVHICNYIVDFFVTKKDGQDEIHEVKGYQTAVWKIKWSLTKALYGSRYKMILV